MNFKYIYIDESGDLGFDEKSSKFIIISALILDNFKELDRIIKNMRRNKFSKELKKMNELKAYKLYDVIRIYMLERLNFVSGAIVSYVILEKRKVFSDFLKNDKNKLYNFIAGKLAKNLMMNNIDRKSVV